MSLSNESVASLLDLPQFGAASLPRICYDARINTVQQHTLDVDLWIDQCDSRSLEIVFPVWTPGSYMIREYSRNVEWLHAHWYMRQSSSNSSSKLAAEKIPLEKTSKNRWKIKVPAQLAQGTICVCYQLYCREMSVRTNWIDRDFALITGAAAFPWVVGYESEPLLLRLQLPSHWPSMATSLQQLARQEDRYTMSADNYDMLVDSPIVCGQLHTRQFEEHAKQHQLVVVGSDELWDLDRAAADTQKLVAAQCEFWKDVPYEHYSFLNLLTETGGGLEHDNSSVLMASRWAMRKRETYLNWLSLVSHEFFHTWNVRRLRPSVLTKYDYEHEQYVRELWVSEGITSYYDDLFVLRTGLCTSDEYLQRLSKSIQSVQSSPGRLIQPLVEASWDAWIKHYRPDENSENSRISYYLKGALVAWMLDAQIRMATTNAYSLDDVMRRLWTRYRSGGFTLIQFEQLVAEVAGRSVQQWLLKNTYEAIELDYAQVLTWFGLRFKPGAIADGQSSSSRGLIGIDTTVAEGRLIVRRVIRGSPADLAGLNADDELIAFNGYRISPGDWQERFAMLNFGAGIELVISRRGKLTSLQFGPINQQDTSTWQLEFEPNCSSDSEQNRRQWMA